ncbi:DMT family transporter [Taklimakanibacter lacteus]|uniref:DMT family transporter n=1 Tax=Taklimakanibacter lacteus TaxID=2268456 RepID=UPI000E67031F
MTSGHPARKARIGIILAGVAALTLAINDVSVPFAYAQGFNPPTVVLARYIFLLGGLVLALPLLGLGFRLARNHAFHALGSGITAAIGALGLLGSFAYIPVSLGVVILYTFPIITTLLECAQARRFPGAIELACLIAALIGVGIAIGLNDMSLDPRGIALAGLSAVGFAISIFWNSIKLRTADGTIVTFYMAIAGVATAVLYLSLTQGLALTGAGFTGWLPLAVTCFFFAISYIGMFKAVELAGGAPTAMVLNLEPVFAIGLAALFLGEALTLPRLLGSALVIGAVVLSEFSRGRKDVAVELAG